MVEVGEVQPFGFALLSTIALASFRFGLLDLVFLLSNVLLSINRHRRPGDDERRLLYLPQ